MNTSNEHNTVLRNSSRISVFVYISFIFTIIIVIAVFFIVQIIFFANKEQANESPTKTEVEIEI